MSVKAEKKNAGLLFDMFEASEKGEVSINSKGPETRSRFPGDKRSLTTSTMVVVDCGNTHATRYDGVSGKHKTVEEAVDSVVTVSHEDILKLPEELPEGTMLVSEYAHVGCPRQGKSKSQPFTEEELLDFYERCKQNNIVLKLFPQGSTPVALDLSGLEKSDKNDPVAIFRFLERFPQTCLMNPPSSFDPSEVVLEGWKSKQEVTDILNFARCFDYDDPNDKNVQWIKERLEEIESQLSNRAKDVFGLTERKKSGADKGNFKDTKLSQMYSVLTLLRDADGNLRLREATGELSGWQNVKRRVIHMSPFHRRGGVARSNFYHHGIKHYVSRKMDNKVLNENNHRIVKKRKDFSVQEEQEFRYHRGEYCKSIRELFQVMKRMLQNDC